MTDVLTTPSWTPQETVAHFAQQIKLPVLHEMLVIFFKAKAADKGNTLIRRPPIAVRLLDGVDHVYTIRPGWTKPGRFLVNKASYQPETHEEFLSIEGERCIVQRYGAFDYKHLYVDAIHQANGKCCKLYFDDELMKLSSWYTSRYFEALENFAQTAKEFVLFPWQVFSRSKNSCCICGKHLTDEISRSRGIGPECIKIVGNCFGRHP